MDYLTNVFMSSASYLVVGLFLFAVSFFVPKIIDLDKQEKMGDAVSKPFHPRRVVRKIALIIIVFGLLMGFISPSNTPKNTLNTNKTAENRAITNTILSKEAQPVQSIAAEPKLTDEERAERFKEQVDLNKSG